VGGSRGWTKEFPEGCINKTSLTEGFTNFDGFYGDVIFNLKAVASALLVLASALLVLASALLVLAKA
jgi:hypothetical protein